MEFKDIWNDMCYRINNKNRNASEHDFQIIAESLFEKLGWVQYKGEIITQEVIPVGSSGNVKPDIIIKNNGETLFVVELKKPGITMSERNGEQLISYMRLLKLNFGILFGETLQIYYELADNNKKPPVKINEICFTTDSNEGIDFIKLLSKNEYTFEKLQKYCIGELAKKEKYENSQKYINLLCSADGPEFILNLLKEKLSTENSEGIIKSIIDSINIHITKKREIIPPGPLPTSNDLKSAKAKKLCKVNGVTLNGKITFASLNTASPVYWANPNVKFLKHDWWLLLNDYKHCELHIFNIPANSIKSDQLKVRADSPSKIDLQIKYEDDLFEDSRSHIQFVKWYKKAISY
jgi:hypothetical protein